jgi:Na+/H+ antiporter NhaD/arsenite permease-like protein
MPWPDTPSVIATSLFVLAVIHTFVANRIHLFAKRYPEDSFRFEVCQFFGEIEAVFPFWGAILLLAIGFLDGREKAIQYSEQLNFKEPIFVFVIMVTAATRPIHRFALQCIDALAKMISRLRVMPRQSAVYLTSLALGPLLGSFITEPAAMTITAWVLRDRYYEYPVSERFKYLTLAVLFVNVSIGGVLTPYAAPPVLMVAGKWGWGFQEMIHLFGWKAAIAVLINAGLATFVLRKELSSLDARAHSPDQEKLSNWIIVLHLLVLAGIVWNHDHPVFFAGLFLIFLALFNITRRHHEELKLRESLLVAAFLGGLVVLGNLQDWWLEPLIRRLDSFQLFLGATTLTAITDNAALTYLGSQVEGLAPLAQYALLAGSVAGGGLTVIANAPNPAGYSILQSRFGERGIQPVLLLGYALIPTLIALVGFWLFHP